LLLDNGWRAQVHARLASTNDAARACALAGDPGRLWIVADEQLAGRGRHGRAWSSPPGNLYASALLIDPCDSALAPQLGFVAGVALARAVEDLGAPDVKLKWPNDLVWRGAKLAGLLVEGAATPGRGLACIVGVGVNCASAPAGLAYPVSSLAAVLGRPVAPHELLSLLAARFDQAIGLWRRGPGFSQIRSQWLERAAGLGAPIRVAGPRGPCEGVFETLDASGRLLLRGPRGLEAIEAGDVFFIPPAAPDAPPN